MHFIVNVDILLKCPVSKTVNIPNSSNSGEKIDGRAGIIISDLDENIQAPDMSLFDKLESRNTFLYTVTLNQYSHTSYRTFSSFLSLPVWRNSSIFSAILAPTPSCKKVMKYKCGDRREWDAEFSEDI